MLNIILACTKQYGIAYKNGIPWHLTDDLKIFKSITKGNRHQDMGMGQDVLNALIMGRKTADTFPAPLVHRHNIVMTSDGGYREGGGFIVRESLVDSLECAVRLGAPEIFVIGGAQIVTETLKYPNLIDKVYLTIVNDEYECDTFVSDLGEHIESNMTLLSKDDSATTHTY